MESYIDMLTHYDSLVVSKGCMVGSVHNLQRFLRSGNKLWIGSPQRMVRLSSRNLDQKGTSSPKMQYLFWELLLSDVCPKWIGIIRWNGKPYFDMMAGKTCLSGKAMSYMCDALKVYKKVTSCYTFIRTQLHYSSSACRIILRGCKGLDVTYRANWEDEVPH